MLLLQTRYTRSDPRFPSTTLFRSVIHASSDKPYVGQASSSANMNRSFIKNFPRSLARFIASLPCLPSSEGKAEYPLGQASFSRCPYDTFLFRSAAGTNVMEDLWCLTGHSQARSEGTSFELQSLKSISYAVFCL